MWKRTLSALLTAAVLLTLLGGCGQQEAGNMPEITQPEIEEAAYLPESTVPVETVHLEDEAVALADAPPALPVTLSALRGDQVKSNERAEIDYSHLEDGYVMACVKVDSGKRWKIKVDGPTATDYTYNLTPELWAAFPLSDGNGAYKITIYENVSGNKYSSVLSQSVTVTLKDEYAPFLHSNQYVDYDAAPKTVAKAAELTANTADALSKVALVYDYVVGSMSYDYDLAATVKSGYLPVLDTVLEKKSGICFDYAALMTGMLRSQGVPCKLVVGYAGTAYHAWISVWTAEHGWVDNVIYFNGSAWQRMDPTFASTSGKDPAIMKFIGDGANYTAKYFY